MLHSCICGKFFSDVTKLLDDEKKQFSDWEARYAFAADFRSTLNVSLINFEVRAFLVIPTGHSHSFEVKSINVPGSIYMGKLVVEGM